VPPKLSATTQLQLDRVFPGDERGEAAAVLIEECGTNLPLMEDANELELERVRCAALKLSDGYLAKLREAVEVAKTDWRDVLVAAGFGNDLHAHERWRPSS
jgi:hypothetical protein